MKQLVVLFLGLSVLSATAKAQFKAPALDKSPMDMSYFPANFPILKIQNKAPEPLLARVLYSRPQKKRPQCIWGIDRIWQDLAPRVANEATEIELYKDAKIDNTRLKKGRYSLYAIPFQDKWTLIFNRETDIWGAFQYDDKKDVLRTNVKLENQQEPIEAFTLLFDKTDSGANMIMAWDNVKATLPITFIK
jgi:hypothetical protein